MLKKGEFMLHIVSTRAQSMIATFCFLQEKLSRLLEAFLYFAAESSRAFYLKAYALVRSDKLLEDDENKETKD